MYDSRFFPKLAGLSAGARVRTPGEVAQALLAAWNDQDPDQVAALHAPDYLGRDIAQTADQHGPAEVRRLAAFYFRAFPDLTATLESLVFQGDQAVLGWTWRGTHRATFMHIPPTGRLVSVRGITWLTVSGGLIRRASRVWDLAGLLRALGLLPDL